MCECGMMGYDAVGELQLLRECQENTAKEQMLFERRRCMCDGLEDSMRWNLPLISGGMLWVLAPLMCLRIDLSQPIRGL